MRRTLETEEECMMSCCEGTRSLHKRYKIALAYKMLLLGGDADADGEEGPQAGSLIKACASGPRTLLRATQNGQTRDAECSRVCGMMALGQTDSSSSRNKSGSDSSSSDSHGRSRRDSNDYGAFSISDPTKSDRPRLLGDCSGTNSNSSSSSSSNSISNSWSDYENTSINTIGTAYGGQRRGEELLGRRMDDVPDGTVRKRKVRVRTEPWRRGKGTAGCCSVVAGSSFASMAILALLCQTVGAVLLDTNGPGGEGKAPVQAFGDELGGSNLERSIAAVFSRVAYGSTTTTKRSIPDNVYVPSLTTVSTPLLTTFRYREKDKEPHGGGAGGGGGGGGLGGSSGNDKDPHYNHQQISANHRNYELDLERDHVLPTSAPNAEILKSNSNPTYPNPNRHHNHDRHRHSNSTPYPHGHNAKKGFPTNSMFSGDVPAYSPPSRAFFTPPLPRNYTNPFADKPTLRGTNSDTTIINTGTYANRRPLPPPSLMPGHERIPMRPPDLVPGAPGSGPGPVSLGGGNGAGGSSINPQKPGLSDGGGPLVPQAGGTGQQGSMVEAQRKKALNTPSDKASKLDSAKGTGGGGYDSNGNKLFLLDENANSSAILPNGMHFPSISRILSGSNGRPQSIPDVLLRSVTSAPRPNQPSFDIGGPGMGPGSTALNNGKHLGYGGGSGATGGNPAIAGTDAGSKTAEGDGGELLGADGGAGNSDGDGRRQFDEDEEEDEEEEDDDPFDDDGPRKGGTSHSAGTGITSTVSSMHVLSSSSSPITQKMPNLNLKSVMIKNGTGGGGGEDGTGGGGGADRNFQGEMADISTWTIAWNIHVYLSAILFTILAVYSIFKIIFYDKLTHLFSQSYFISIHLILIIICLLRIFYLCYDAYNIHFSFNLFTSELLLNLPLTFLTTTFAILILFLLLRSINHKTNRYSSILRPLTIIIGSGVHVGLCITLHLVESYETQQFYHKQQQLQLQNKQLMMTAGGVRGGGGGGGTGHQHHGGGLPANNIQIPPRVLSLICQIIYIFICLSLGILYLYMYRLLKRILNKSQNYIHGYNNLSYAIHITIATALLFILLAALQIYGAISISSQTKVKLSPSNSLHDGGAAKQTLWASHIEIDWFQWGYQFSLRFIEIVIIALLSWVTGLKTGTSKVIQREKDMEQPNASGFALFPCTSSSSQENFETDYPAVCNTNRNLHTYTMRTGKPIYDDNFALNSLNLEQNSQQDLQLGPPGSGVGPGVIVGGNDFQRSIETNSMRSSSHNYSNNYNGGSSADHNMPDGDDFLNDTETMPDHYENPNFELKHHHHHHHHGGGGSGSASVNHQYHDIMDNCYSEPINAPQYDTKSLRGGGHPASMVGGPGRNYDFQNFERPNFDTAHPGAAPGGGGMGPVPSHSALAAAQSMSRNEFRASKNLKTLKSGQQQQQQQMQNDLGGANTMGHHHHYNHHNQMGPGGVGGNYGDSFDRRIGVRKSGTLNNIGAMHFNQHGGGSGRNNNSNSSASSSSNSSNNRAALQQQQQQQRGVAPPGQQHRGAGPLSGAQTLSSSRSNDHHHHHHHPGHAYPVPQPGSFNDRLLNGGVPGADSLERHAHQSQDNMSNNFDDPALGGGMVNGGGPAYYHSKKRSRDSSSSSCYTGGGGGGPGGAVPYATGGGAGGLGGPDHQATTTTTTATESSSSPTASIGGSNTSGNGTPTTGVLPGKLSGEVASGGGPASSGPAGNGSMLVAEQGFVRFRALEEPSLGASQRNNSAANVNANNSKLFMNA